MIEIFENVAPPTLAAAAWATCMGSSWRFGHGSIEGGNARFWRMELSGDAAFTAIWESVRPRCEALAGFPLRVAQQYANGHTYGQGGNAHIDDRREGTFTLLYYPNPEWEEEWEGETVFYGEDREILLSTRLRPNRAVFFDSRIRHRGRCPSRACPLLRVSVAYKLEPAAGPKGVSMPPPPAEAPVRRDASEAFLDVLETEREGATRIYKARIGDERIQSLTQACLADLTRNLSLPGFAAGKAPPDVLRQRYGAQARREALRLLSAEVVNTGLPAGNIAYSCALVSGAESGPAEIRIRATHLPDVPTPDFRNPPLERIVFATTTAETEALVQAHLKKQALDRLDSAHSIPLFPGIVDREFSALWKFAESSGALPEANEERAQCAEELRAIACRRLRLGYLIVEFARRLGMDSADGPALEMRIVDYFLSRAAIIDREPTASELAEMREG
jgi:SM-20-related protein